MRILHTSDWHIGKRLHGVELLDHQQAFVDWLVDVVADQGIDAVVVAGDLYDRSNPAVDAIGLFDDAVARLAATRVPLIMISGNHDSGPRVGTHAGLLQDVGVHLATEPATIGTPVVLADDDGELPVYCLPYLDPTLTRGVLDAPGASHIDVLTAAMARVKADVGHRGAKRSMVVAHAFVAGGTVSDSERDLAVGGAAAVPVSLFDGVSYTALGHLHGPQNVGDNVRYSGSPLAYSFSEQNHRKSITVIDVSADGTVTTAVIETPVSRQLATMTGTLEELCTEDRFQSLEDAWVRAIITDALLPTAPMDRLRQRFPHALHLEHRPERVDGPAPETRAERLEGLDDLAVTVEFFTEQVGRAPVDAELGVLAEAVGSALDVEVAG